MSLDFCNMQNLNSMKSIDYLYQMIRLLVVMQWCRVFSGTLGHHVHPFIITVYPTDGSFH